MPSRERSSRATSKPVRSITARGERSGARKVETNALAGAHAAPAERVLSDLESSAAGLDEDEVRARLERYGPNALSVARARPAWRILLDQMRSVVVLLLVVAAAGAFALGDRLEAAAIAAVLLINVALGFITELRARRALDALLSFDVPRTRVVRGGQVQEVDARSIVPGDVLALEAGQSVAADARVISSAELRTAEAALTGESLPVDKRADQDLDIDTPLADRATMVYKGTSVVAGTANAVVVATGMATAIGGVGKLVAGVQEEKTPLERRLASLGARLIILAVGVAALVGLLGALRGQPLDEMIKTALALAIAAVPEGLPAIITIALAVGVGRMARRNVITRRLPAVEALGAATIICTDKTGTLTAGQMTATTLIIAERAYQVGGDGYAPEGDFRLDGNPVSGAAAELVARVLRAGVLPNAGGIKQTDGEWTAVGDPTDAALIAAGRKAGLEQDALLREERRTREIPFASERQFAASFHKRDGGTFVYVKGGPGRVLERCGRWLSRDGEQALDKNARDRLLELNAELATRGLRVLALADGEVHESTDEALRDLTFLGLVGMIDPPAAGVRETIGLFRKAGIRTVMITGDQHRTAEAVGRELGVIGEGEDVLDARELSKLADDALADRLLRTGAISRVGPEDKLRLVDAFQRRGEIVAMLGDGVNDAPALKSADVGVAMGRRGTDVAREAAAVVLQDDRFPTIGAAIEEGRVIYDNIRKFVFYLFSCNLSEILVLLGAGLVGLPLPLLPLQILWLNLVTDTFPALSLALEPAEPDVMRRPPRDPRAAIMSAAFLRSVSAYGFLIGAVCMAAYAYGLIVRGNIEEARTICFMTLAIAQTFHLVNARSRHAVLFTSRMLSNRWALLAALLVLGLQLVAVYAPPLALVLEVVPPSGSDWLVILGLSLVPALVGQAIRWRAAGGGEV